MDTLTDENEKKNGIQLRASISNGVQARTERVYSIVKASSHNTLEKYLFMRCLLFTIGYGFPFDLSFFLELYQKRYAVLKNREWLN